MTEFIKISLWVSKIVNTIPPIIFYRRYMYYYKLKYFLDIVEILKLLRNLSLKRFLRFSDVTVLR